jgi:hypothetical protein
MKSVPYVRPLLACAFLGVVAATAGAQDFNLDVGGVGNTVPSPAYGAAAARPGTWSSLNAESTAAQPLVNVAGGATSVTATCSGGLWFEANANLAGASPDALALMADVHDPEDVPRTWSFNGLAAGTYDVYTISMAPDEAAFRTNVSVAGSADPLQTVGGAWSGTFLQLATHAKHRVVTTGGPVVVTVVFTPPPGGPVLNYGSVNGFQIVRIDNSVNAAFCFGDGTLTDHTTPCPCANHGAAGRGCANSANVQGASLLATGVPLNNDVVLSAVGMPATVNCIYLQGDAVEDAVFGDGVRCTGGNLIRLRTKQNAGGASSFPDSTDTVTLSERGGVVPGSGALRYYQTYYRNSSASYCPPETFNVTNGWKLTW